MPSIDFESVTDSSRYFVVRLQNDNGQKAFVGIGFADRSDSFDLNVAVQDHFKGLERDSELAKQDSSAPKLDLGFKDGQTININIGVSVFISLFWILEGFGEEEEGNKERLKLLLTNFKSETRDFLTFSDVF